ncbi:UNVERIFIED_CONTAM: DppIII [Trichonephila clavipes]
MMHKMMKVIQSGLLRLQSSQHSNFYGTPCKLVSLPKMSDCIIHANTPFLALDCEDSFRPLSEKEKYYAHYLSKASWMGSLIICLQY